MPVTTREIRVETSTVCNYRCVMCAHSTLARRREVMPDALFARILDAATAELPQLELCTVSGFGELATDPRWQHKLELARARFPRVHVVTNLSLVKDDALEALAALATEARVSVYGVDEETYRRVHRPPESVSYRTIEARILRLAELRRRTGLVLGLTSCELDENRAQIPRWVERWEGIVDHLEVWRPHNWVDGRRYRSLDDERVASCGRPASGPLQVQVDGTMNVCCFDFDGKMVIGDLKRQTFTEILEGRELRRVRELHAAGRADDLPLCAICDQREPPGRKQAHLLHCSRAAAAEDDDAPPGRGSVALDRVLRTSSGMERLPDPDSEK